MKDGNSKRRAGQKDPCRSGGVRGRAGFTLLEMLVALIVLSVGVLGYMAMQFSTMSGRTFARSMNSATVAGIANLEEMHTRNIDQVDAGTFYRFRADNSEATEADFENGNAYKIERAVGNFTGIGSNPNLRLAELKATHTVVRWKERGMEYSMILGTLHRPD